MEFSEQTYINLLKNLYKSNSQEKSLTRMYVNRAIKDKIFREELIETLFKMEENKEISEEEKNFYKNKRYEIVEKLMERIY
jgi:hypothetical protein